MDTEIEQLYNELYIASNNIAYEAALALANLSVKADNVVIPLLFRALLERHVVPSNSAAHGLGRIGLTHPLVQEGWISLIHDSDPYVRSRALLIMEYAVDDYCVEPYVSLLRSALDDNDADVRADSGRFFGGCITEDRIKEALELLAFRPDLGGDTQISIDLQFQTLGQRAVPALLALLEDPRPAIRIQALSMLRSTGSKLLTDRSLAALADVDPAVRANAAVHLGFSKSINPNIILSLRQALQDPAPNVRMQAAYALGQLDAQDALSDLHDALSDADPEVRKAVEATIRRLKKI
jgi:HEAT repeat protein